MPCYRRPCSASRPLYCDDACCACIQQHTLIFDVRDFDAMCRRRLGSFIIQEQIHAGRALRGVIFQAKHATGGSEPIDYAAWPLFGMASCVPVAIVVTPLSHVLNPIGQDVLRRLSDAGLVVGTASNLAEAKRLIRRAEKIAHRPSLT